MAKSEISVSRFLSGFNCSQAILCTYGTEYGIHFDTAVKISCGCAGVPECGAVSAANMVLGLHFASEDPNDRGKKEYAYKKAAEFNERFKGRFGTTLCDKLLDSMHLSGESQVVNSGSISLNLEYCSKIVKTAAEFLEEMLAVSQTLEKVSV